MIRMPGHSYRGPFPPLSEAEAQIRARLEGSVQALAGEIGERNLWRFEALEAAARYVETAFEGLGYKPATQEFESGGKIVRNVEAEIPGATHPEEIVIAGAHYDSVIGSPGANDNASGVAALLEIARLLAGQAFPRTVRFVGFANEEPPFFQTGEMGSGVYSRRARAQGENIVAMLSLETIGCYSDQKGSQKYPFPFSLFYPDTGNFIGFVGNLASAGLTRRVVASFRRHAAFPSEGAAIPAWIVGVGWSDHWAFWQQGYPALMVTDTAPFRYEHYHSEEDTPDKVDYERMARVVAGLTHVIADLAGAKSQ